MTNLIQIVSVIAVIRNQEGKYLLVRRNLDDDIFPGKWQNLGGKMEIGESVEQSLIREIKEEVGIGLPADQKFTFILSYSWQKDPGETSRLGLIFLTTINSGHPVVLSSELMEYGWFDTNEISNLDTIGRDSPTGTLGQIQKATKI